MDVSFLTIGGRERASSRYRAFYLREFLNNQDINCNIYRSGFTNRRIIRRIGDFLSPLRSTILAYKSDIFVLQKVLPGRVTIRLLKKAAGRLVYDFDDAIHITPEWRRGDRTEREGLLKRTLDEASCVIAGNPLLADYARQHCDDVYVVPTGIPKRKYVSRNKDKCRRCSEKIVLGWIGMGHNLWYLRQFESKICSILDANKSVELWIVTGGQDVGRPFGERRGNDVRYIQWSESRELEYLSMFDIGIRPLTYDEFTRAKGGFTSVIQCMAMGKPVVVTPVSMLSTIVEHGENGFHAEKPDHWVEYMQKLIDNPGLRKEMGQNAHRRVGQVGFWTEQVAEKLVSIFKEI